MESIIWKEFKIEELFAVKTSKGIDSNKLTLNKKSEVNCYSFIGRTKTNYGIQGFTCKQEFEPNAANIFSVSQIGSVHSQFRSEEWYSSQNMFVLTPLEENLAGQYVKLFIESSINKAFAKYQDSYTSYPTLGSLKEMSIKLPANPLGEPDYEFMANHIKQIQANHIKQIQANHIKQIQAYIKVAGENNPYLNGGAPLLLSQKKHGEFRLSDIFEIKRGDISNQNELIHNEDGTLFVAQNDSKNGFAGRVLKQDYQEFQPALIIGRQTAVTYWIDEPFMTTDGVLVLKQKEGLPALKDLSGLFLANILKKNLQLFGYSNTVSAQKLNNIILNLPSADNGSPDFEYMEDYIKFFQAEYIRKLQAKCTAIEEAYSSIV